MRVVVLHQNPTVEFTQGNIFALKILLLQESCCTHATLAPAAIWDLQIVRSETPHANSCENVEPTSCIQCHILDAFCNRTLCNMPSMQTTLIVDANCHYAAGSAFPCSVFWETSAFPCKPDGSGWHTKITGPCARACSGREETAPTVFNATEAYVMFMSIPSEYSCEYNWRGTSRCVWTDVISSAAKTGLRFEFSDHGLLLFKIVEIDISWPLPKKKQIVQHPFPIFCGGLSISFKVTELG